MATSDLFSARPTHDGLVGAVKGVFRYPIKSVGGHSLTTAHIGPDGVVGDHQFAFYDLATGNICNAKNPRKFGAMLQCRASYVEDPQAGSPLPPIEVMFPDGQVHHSDSRTLDKAMSDYLGRQVTLVDTVPAGAMNEIVYLDDVGMDKGTIYEDVAVDRDGDQVTSYEQTGVETFFGLDPIHLITTSTIETFRHLNPGANFDYRRYRPTILVESTAPGFIEDAWQNKSVHVGEEAVLRVTIPCPRCVMTTLQHAEDVLVDRGTLRTIVKHNTQEVPGFGRWGTAGVYAQIASTGTVTIGDPVSLGP